VSELEMGGVEHDLVVPKQVLIVAPCIHRYEIPLE